MCVHKSFGEPPNKPHDWPPFVFKNNRQTDDFDTTHQQKGENKRKHRATCVTICLDNYLNMLNF